MADKILALLPNENDTEEELSFIPESLLETSLGELDLSQRTYNVLRRAGISFVGDFLPFSYADIRKFRNCGRIGCDELRHKFISLGIMLREE